MGMAGKGMDTGIARGARVRALARGLALGLAVAGFGWVAEAAAGGVMELGEALERAGGNRAELEKALAGPHAAEVEFLVRRANQFDLVNLTADILNNHAGAAKRARQRLPWGAKVDEAMWREWVLPYRMAEEDVEAWRGLFLDILEPVVEKAAGSHEAARAVHAWLWTPRKVWFEVTENRDQTPLQILNRTKVGRCFELNMLYTALLRSVCVPARVCGTAFWTNHEQYHYWVEYWDTAAGIWRSVEGAGPTGDNFMAINKTAAKSLNRPYAASYALPGYAPVRDIIGAERWDLAVPVTTNTQDCGRLAVAAPRGGTASVLVWNGSAWRAVAMGKENGQGKVLFDLGPNPNGPPYLATVDAGGRVRWALATVEAGRTASVSPASGIAKPEAVFEFPERAKLLAKAAAEKGKDGKKEKGGRQ